MFYKASTVFVVPVREWLVLPEVHPVREKGVLQEEPFPRDVEVVLVGIERLPLDVAGLGGRGVTATLTVSLIYRYNRIFKIFNCIINVRLFVRFRSKRLRFR